MTFAIRFDLPSHETLYAGEQTWEDSIEKARQFETPQEASEMLSACFTHSTKYAVIVDVATVAGCPVHGPDDYAMPRGWFQPDDSPWPTMREQCDALTKARKSR